MRAAVVILNYKGWQDTKKCLAAMKKQTHEDFEIYLIDNGSGDDSVKELSKIRMKNLHFHQEPKNTGFTGGVNIGIRWAIEHGFDAVALLNNDAAPEPDWLKNLAAALEQKPEVGAVTSLMLDTTGNFIDDAGDEYSTWGIPALRAEHLPKDQAPDSGLLFGATGGATLYRTKVFQQISFFGWKVWYEKTAVVFHKHSATSSKIPGFTINQVFKNLPQVFWKNVPFPMIIPMWFKFTMIYFMFMAYQIPKGGFTFAVKGFIQSIGLWPKSLAKRRRIQKTKTVSNAYIKSLLYHGLPLRQVNRIKKALGFK